MAWSESSLVSRIKCSCSVTDCTFTIFGSLLILSLRITLPIISDKNSLPRPCHWSGMLLLGIRHPSCPLLWTQGRSGQLLRHIHEPKSETTSETVINWTSKQTDTQTDLPLAKRSDRIISAWSVWNRYYSTAISTIISNDWNLLETNTI